MCKDYREDGRENERKVIHTIKIGPTSKCGLSTQSKMNGICNRICNIFNIFVVADGGTYVYVHNICILYNVYMFCNKRGVNIRVSFASGCLHFTSDLLQTSVGLTVKRTNQTIMISTIINLDLMVKLNCFKLKNN